MFKNALILKSESQYDVLAHFSTAIECSLIQRGFTTWVIDVAVDDLDAKLTQAFRSGLAFAISFNAMDLEVEGQSLFDTYRCPLITIIVDHPIHHQQFLLDPLKNVLITWPDRGHKKFVLDRFQLNRPMNFLPHGGCLSHQQPMAHSDKKITLLFSGTLYDPNTIYQQLQTSSDDVKKICDGMIDLLMSNESMPFESACDQAWGGISREHPQFSALITWMPLVDLYVRMTKRLKLLEALVRSPLPIMLAGGGPGWKTCKGLEQHHVTFSKKVDFDSLMGLMQQSYFVLNFNPSFSDGSHERVFTAAANGALPVSDRSHYLEEQFTHLDDIYFYDQSEWDALGDQLQELLTQKERVREMTEKCHHKVMNQHLWHHRVDEILSWIK